MTSYFAATAPVAVVPREFPFGFIETLPFEYWIALGLSVSLLLLSISSNVLRYLWLSSLLLILLVPSLGNLVRVYPMDSFNAFASERMASTGGFSVSQDLLLNFPGSTVLFACLAIITGAPSLPVVRAFGIGYNWILAALSFVFFRRVGVGQQAAVLAAIVLVLSFYMQGVLLYTSLLGMIFYVEIAALVLAPRDALGRPVKMILLTVLFAAMVVSHAFSPFFTMAAMTATLIGWKPANSLVRRLGLRRLFGDPPPTSASILLLIAVILTAHWMYVASLVFTWGALYLKSVSLLRILEVTSPLVSPMTTYASNYSHVAELYAPLLFFAFGVYILACHDRRGLQLLLWLVGLAATAIFALGGYLQEFVARVFAFAILILSYGVAELFDSRKSLLRRLGLVVVFCTLLLHLPAHYGQDSFVSVLDSSVQGARFITEHSRSNVTIDSILRHYTYNWDQPIVTGSEFLFLLNYETESWVLYSKGDLVLHSFTERLRSSEFDRVYSNGWFDVYSEI